MNTFFLLILGLPAIEIFVLIKVGQQVGALNTIILIFLTAILGVYYARMQGLKTMKSAFGNIYQNKVPFYEIISGASIALGSLLLITPGFITDTIGFLIIIPLTRKLLINYFFKKKYKNKINQENEIMEGEIINKEDKKNNDL